MTTRRAAARGNPIDAALVALLRGHIQPLRGAQLCLAYSGGRDSTVLLSVLAKLRRRAGFTLRAVHVNHGLQAHADDWAHQALSVAAKIGVPAEVLSVRVARRGSLEANARAARYTALRANLAAGEWLVTAHHQEDQLETLLLQLLRGAGLAGMAAMPVVATFGAGFLLRPLLNLPRAALADYAQRHRLQWAEDSSNLDTRFDRNFLRTTVLPLLQERWPAAATTVARAASHLAEAQALLDLMAERQLARAAAGGALDIRVLRRLGVAEQRNALRRWIKLAGLPAPDTARLNQLTGAALQARHDATPLLTWPGTEVRRHGYHLHAMAPLPPAPLAVSWHWRRQRRIVLKGAGELSLQIGPLGDIAIEKLPGKLRLQFRTGGERLALGAGHKPLKNLLQELDLPPWLRGRLPLVYAGDKLVAVANLWRDPAIAPTKATQRRARLQFASAFE